jgi:hypothetical protein
MASPLCESSGQALNCSTPPSVDRNEAYEVQTYTVASDSSDSPRDSPPPGAALKRKSPADQENVSPSKSRHHRVRSGNELSPLKILSAESGPSSHDSTRPSPSLRSPRKMSPEKRFPVKVSNPLDIPQPQQQQLENGGSTQARTITLDDALKENSGLKHAIDIFEDDQGDVSSAMDMAPDDEEAAGPDDTMVSTFSTFSAVPNMTMFAKLGHSPTRTQPEASPRGPRPEPSRPASHVSKRESSNTTNLLIDFTEGLRNPQRSPGKRMHLDASSETPRRQLSNLIDFDIPPMPTPRSVPSITPRELETLKSNFLSEISSLKASLSGKEAEVQSLKTAVGDAEKRVGESLEKLREEQIAREQVLEEKQEWEHRGREMEVVLRKVKDEIVLGQKERDELERKLDESEKRREAAEMLHQEAESKMAGMRAGRESAKSSPEKARDSPNVNSSQEVELAVERVARELHGLYKGKHEAKVTALKKSYEARWQKKVKELESRVEQLSDENDKLRVGRDATLTKVDPNNSAEFGELKAQAIKDNAAIKELNADVQRLEAVVASVQKDNGELRVMLENERVEKGELVQLAEEMMSMQSFVGPSQTPARPSMPVEQTPQMPPSSPQRRNPDGLAAKTPKTDVKNRMGRASGLRAPGTALRAPHERNKSAGALPRPGGVARSGIMSSIEKMGSHRGRGAAD